MANLNKIQHLTFIEDRGQDKNFNHLALYHCVCGNEKVYPKKEVRNMRKTACGCMRFGDNNKWTQTHGLRNHPAYNCWKLMIKRCEDPNNSSYEDYGARGITVCTEWHDIKVFIEWVEANGYKHGLQLDRRENNGNYEPANCRFVTNKENGNNRRNNRYIEFNGIRQTVQQWADQIGISSSTLRARIDKHKIPLERALRKNANKHAFGE